MDNIHLGVFLHCMKLPGEDALRTAAALGFEGVQLWNVGGEFDPQVMTEERICKLQSFLSEHDMEISSLCGHMSFVDPSASQDNIRKMHDILNLASKLNVRIVTTESGILPQGMDIDRAWTILVESMKRICRDAHEMGVSIAIEPGSKCVVNGPPTLIRLLEQVESPALGINFDPANVYKAGYDPISGVKELRHYLLHCHAKDAKRLPQGGYMETPLGQGDVPLREFVEALEEIGFHGFLVVEREVGEDPLKDIREAKVYLEKILHRENMA